ncbi:MAG: hypothetical protein GYA55_14025, partial [SAR324 cluster bacterium]|nr:hypothetical protein [SAR324 cluster bacterium]
MGNDYFAGDGAACARIKSRYVPGILMMVDRFLPYSADIKNNLKLAKKARGEAKTKLLKKIAALKKLNKKYGAICAAGPEGRADAGDLAPTKADQAVMDKIVSRFLKLEASAGTKEALAKLVKELKKTARVAKTVVSKDLSHITVVLDDGMEFGINTDDSFAAEGSSASSIMQSSVPAAVHDAAAVRASLIEKVASSAVCSSIVTPSSRKALLVLAMSSVKNPIAMRAINEIKATLLLLGWADDDIDIRTRFETVNKKGEWVKDFSFTPDSILDMSGYGLVMFFGHGG